MRSLIVFTLSLLIINNVLEAQVFVNQNPANKVVVLEEFTAINCGYCPQGHAIAESIRSSNPDSVIIVNLHTGHLAAPSAGEPDFRTSYGGAIASQSSLTGYPAATVNRHVFSGLSMSSGGTAMPRPNWTQASNIIFPQASYVNVAVRCTVDVQTRIASIHAQAYYTGNSPQSTNKITLALLQDKTYGPQAGGSTPYEHNHRLVDMLAGQWGVDISNTSTGSLYDSVFTYQIPADLNNIPIELGNIKFTAYVSETQQEIISGAVAHPIYVNFPNTKDLSINDLDLPEISCTGEETAEIEVQNLAQDTIFDFTIAYNFNNATDSVYNWTGTLPPLGKTTIQLPAYSFALIPLNDFQAVITDINGSGLDDNQNNDTITQTVEQAKTAHPEIIIEVQTDAYADETKWYLRYANGTTLAFKTSGFSNLTIHRDTINVQNSGCYEFQITDSYGDGFLSPGYYKITDGNGQVIVHQTNFNSDEEFTPFEVDTYLAIQDNKIASLNVFPNPTKDIVNLEFYLDKEEDVKTIVYNQQGKVVSETNYGKALGNAILQINTDGFSSGIYYIRLIAGEKQYSKKISVLK